MRSPAWASARRARSTPRPGTVSNVVNIRDWDGAFPLGETLGSALGVPVAIGNDVQVATEAEATLGAGT